ncbi:hypothetical protein SKAU_G00347730 [Synaphobranchus kaupii]|uniref:Pleckstrin homology domain-containing family F member 1 n=1 Tax=Synaphobranchus kaupii TaxID=118154 RepID=A0A9Q1IGW8_SYNKA|nr:hypothetical protein SKAU_G00347730 [Synaphobranchus kaupii]
MRGTLLKYTGSLLRDRIYCISRDANQPRGKSLRMTSQAAQDSTHFLQQEIQNTVYKRTCCICITLGLRKRETSYRKRNGHVHRHPSNKLYTVQSRKGVKLAMGDQLAFTEQNAERIQAVQALFGALGKPLAKPGRVLVGEGHLLKLCRRSPQPKAFFLFNDILVYGTIVLRGRWCTNQQVVPLEDVSLEDTEDGLAMKNRWLIRTPRKSFYVSAASLEEKQAWMEHIRECQAERLLSTGRPAGTRFAAVWIPDRASATCMRCCVRFGLAQRRHHCRHCGFVVCASCSRDRFVIPDISAKPVRVCQPCHSSLRSQECRTGQPSQCATQPNRSRGGSDGKTWSDEDEPVYELSSGEDNDGEGYEDPVPSQWVSPQNHIRQSSWSPYIDLRKSSRDF